MNEFSVMWVAYITFHHSFQVSGILGSKNYKLEGPGKVIKIEIARKSLISFNQLCFISSLVVVFS